MEQASETVTALHRTDRYQQRVGGLAGSPLSKPLMWPGVVVVLDELAQHTLQVRVWLGFVRHQRFAGKGERIRTLSWASVGTPPNGSIACTGRRS